MTKDDYPYASPPEAKPWQPKWSAVRSAVGLPVVMPPDLAPREAPPLILIVAAVVTVLAVGNATMAPVASSMGPGPAFMLGVSYVMSILGTIGAQAVLLSIMLVFAEGPLWQRLAWHWGLAWMAFTAWCFGFAIAEARWVMTASTFPREELTAAMCGLPLISLTCQAPMWLFRHYFNWRIELPGDGKAEDGGQRLSIRDFVVGTILTAVTMAVFRLGKPTTVVDSEYWTAWAIGSAATAGNSLICVMPIVYMTLAARRTAWGVYGVVAMIVAAATISSTLLIWFAPSGPSRREIIVMMVSLACSSAGTLAGTLWIARAYGYRLVTGRMAAEQPVNSPFAPPPADPPAA